MNILSTLAAALGVVVALAMASLFGWERPRAADGVKTYAALDGLRGLLALFVFLCHADAWYFASHHQGWNSDMRLFLHLGQSSVALFFMITAFLFVGRLVDVRGRSIDWLRLYVSRVLRLAPAYWLAMVLMFVVVAIVTEAGIDGAGAGIVLRSWTDIFSSMAVWLSFCMLGEPPIDAYVNTPMIVAGVVWSMPFEWTFYCALPLFALLLRVAMPAGALLVGLASVVWLFLWRGAPSPLLAVPFVGGVAAVFAVRQPWFASFARTKKGAVVAIASLIALVTLCPSPYGIAPLLLQGLAFALIAGGCDVFGLLSSRAARALGSLSYGVYLLHGIVLYMTFMVLIGIERAHFFSPWMHWAVVLADVPLLLLLALACHRWVELPAMRAVGPCVELLRSSVRRIPAQPRPTLGDAG